MEEEFGTDVVGVEAKSEPKPGQPPKRNRKAAPKADKATPPKPEPKPEVKPEPKPKAASRYLRAARIILEHGDDIDAEYLALEMSGSPATAAYCLEAFNSVCQALREAGKLPKAKVAK